MSFPVKENKTYTLKVEKDNSDIAKVAIRGSSLHIGITSILSVLDQLVS